MQKEPMNIFERLGVMNIIMVTIVAVVRGCIYV